MYGKAEELYTSREQSGLLFCLPLRVCYESIRLIGRTSRVNLSGPFSDVRSILMGRRSWSTRELQAPVSSSFPAEGGLHEG